MIPARLKSSPGPFHILEPNQNTITLIINGCAAQVVALPSGAAVSALQVAQTITSVAVGILATVSTEGAVLLTSTVSGVGSSIQIPSSLTASALGFISPNNVAQGSDDDPPVADSIDPACYLVYGGILVTVKGSNFKPGVTVSVGGGLLTEINLVDTNTIQGILPRGLPGNFDVVITNPDLQISTIVQGFSYIAVPTPQILSVNPNQGYLFGGNKIFISGAAFSFGMKFKIGSKELTAVIVKSPTEAEGIVPQGPGFGFFDVEGITVDNSVGLLQDGYQYVKAPAPGILGVIPSTGPLAGGTQIRIVGSNFIEGADVRFGVHSSTNVTFNSSTSLSVILPSGDNLGAVDVLVTNQDGGQGILPKSFYYVKAPGEDTGIIITPNSGLQSGGTPVTITGSNFQVGALVDFGGAQASEIQILGSGQINAIVPPSGIGPVSVTITNPDTQKGIKENGFTYLPLPDVAQVSSAALCNTQGMDSGVSSTLQQINNLGVKAQAMVSEIDKRLDPYGPAVSVMDNISVGDTELYLKSESLGLQDIGIVADQNNPDGEQFTVMSIEPQLDGSFKITTKDPLKFSYDVSAQSFVKRYNTEYDDYNSVTKVLSDVRTTDQLSAAKDFLDEFIGFVSDNLDPNL